MNIFGVILALFVAQAGAPVAPADVDWLIAPRGTHRAVIAPSSDNRDLVLRNGLIERRIRWTNGGATVSFDNLMTGASLLRAVRPEARVTIDGVSYDVGGLSGQPNHAYLLDEWLDEMTPVDGAFVYRGARPSTASIPFEWARSRHHAPDAAWPPPGQGVRLLYSLEPPDDEADRLPAHDVSLRVHYEIYDDLPVIRKWVEIKNEGDEPVEIDTLTTEILAVVPYEDPVESRDGVAISPPDLHVESDYAFGGMSSKTAARHAVHWGPDPAFDSQVNWSRQNPCLLEVRPPRGPDVILQPGEILISLNVYELVHDSSDRERRGLALRRMYRTLAPWVTENPLILHVVSSDPEVVRRAIDQAADCGFEMVSLSFGSGLNMEIEDEAYHQRFKELATYAAGKSIELGGYSLLSSRRVQPDTENCVNPETGEPGGQTHGFCPALASEWGLAYFRRLREFFEATGFMQFTHDGSYPGDFDAAARPPLQRGLDDSQWVQWKIITAFYKWARARGIYLRVPDYYYLAGSNECGMGYREVNWSLPRAQQVIHTRQNIYDGTWEKTPSMGWMFVPLTQYHGGGAAATIEPLSEHLDHYEQMLTSNLGLGVQAVYRGMRLYDTDETRAVVTRWVEWFKTYRDILESDLIHGRRADGRDIDWMLHVNPHLDIRGMLCVYNPRDHDVRKTIKVNVYYTGLTGTVDISEADGLPVRTPIGPHGWVEIEVRVPAGGMQWFVLRP